MISKPTVLVLGAGASIDFQFPSGIELADRIVHRTGIDGAVSQALHELGFLPPDVGQFSDSLNGSGCMSVDEFLATRADLVPIGKALIAAALITYEQAGYVYGRRPGAGPSWLQVLAARMAAPLDDWAENKLSIVTFNYDRVVEFFLHASLVNRFRLSDDDAARLLKKTVKIIHVHGQMGSLHGLGSGDPRAFESNMTAHLLRVAAKGIKIIHEGDTGDAAFVEARALIKAAKEVVLMGFGYGETNLARLDLTGLPPARPAVGSAIGMTSHECRVAAKRTKGHLSLDTQSKTLTEFLRKHAVLGH